MVVPIPISELKVILEAAGEGTRMVPLTNYIPKALIPVDSRPVSRHIVDGLLAQGFKEENITFAVNVKQLDLFQFEFRDLKLNWMPSPRALGTAGELQKSRIDEFIGDLHGSPFLLLYGDDLTQINYGDMLEFHYHTVADVTIAVTSKVLLEFGLVYRKPFSNRVERFSEKPYMSELKQSLWTGCALFEEKILPEFREDEDIARHLFPRLLKNPAFTMYAYNSASLWVDVGLISHLRLANEVYAKKPKGKVSPIFLPD